MQQLGCGMQCLSCLLFTFSRQQPVSSDTSATGNNQVQQEHGHGKVGTVGMCKSPESAIIKYRPFGGYESHDHNGQQRDGGQSCHKANKDQEAADHFKRSCKISPEIGIRESDQQEPSGTDHIGQDEFLQAFREEDQSYCQAHDKGRQTVR